MKTLLKSNSRFNLRKDEEPDEEEEDESTEGDETTKALNTAITKELVGILGKAASEEPDPDEEEDEEDDESDEDEEDDEEEGVEKSLKGLPKSTRVMLRKMQKDLKASKAEIKRLKKSQDPASLVIGKDANITVGQLAEFVGKAVMEAQKHIPISSGKVPLKKKEGETDDEFKKRTEEEVEEGPEVGEMVTSVEGLSKLTKDEVEDRIAKGLVPENVLKEALGDEKYAEVRKQGMANRLVAITK